MADRLDAYDEGSRDYECLVNAAVTIATSDLSDDEDGDRGIDKETRSAARSFLRAEFKRINSDDEDEPEETDTPATD